MSISCDRTGRRQALAYMGVQPAAYRGADLGFEDYDTSDLTLWTDY
jgi:hypothetical protein